MIDADGNGVKSHLSGALPAQRYIHGLVTHLDRWLAMASSCDSILLKPAQSLGDSFSGMYSHACMSVVCVDLLHLPPGEDFSSPVQAGRFRRIANSALCSISGNIYAPPSQVGAASSGCQSNIVRMLSPPRWRHLLPRR